MYMVILESANGNKRRNTLWMRLRVGAGKIGEKKLET